MWSIKAQLWPGILASALVKSESLKKAWRSPGSFENRRTSAISYDCAESPVPSGSLLHPASAAKPKYGTKARIRVPRHTDGKCTETARKIKANVIHLLCGFVHLICDLLQAAEADERTFLGKPQVASRSDPARRYTESLHRAISSTGHTRSRESRERTRISASGHWECRTTGCRSKRATSERRGTMRCRM